MKKEEFKFVTICISDQVDQEILRWKSRETSQNQTLTSNLQKAINTFKNLPKALFDSTDGTYHRAYLTKFGNFKQLSLDKQYRLFFRLENGPNPGELVVFLVWVNDESCLHDTFNEQTDPSINQFQIFIETSKGEKYDYDYHVGKEIQQGKLGESFIYRYFEKKNNNSQTQCYLQKGRSSMGKDIYYSDGLTTDHLDVAKEFSLRLADEFKKSKYGLEFRIEKQLRQKIEKHRKVCPSDIYEETSDHDYVIFKI